MPGAHLIASPHVFPQLALSNSRMPPNIGESLICL